MNVANSAAAIEIRCHHCSHFLGEADRPLELVAIVKTRAMRDAIAPPRQSWKCKCGWTSVFRTAEPESQMYGDRALAKARVSAL